MSIAEEKKYFIKPKYDRPKGWPHGWEFPGKAWPPGWPRKYEGKEKICVRWEGDTLVVVVRDEFDEMTDAFDGEYFFITAQNKDGQLVRLRPTPESHWSKAALIRCVEWGVVQPLEFEHTDKGIDLNVSVWGIENEASKAVFEGSV